MTRVFGHGPDDGPLAINTLPSYPWVREQGADGVELDLRITADGRLVVTHDPNDDAPSLADVLELCRGLTVNVEIKNYPRDTEWDPDQRVTHALLDLLATRDDDILVSCFDFGALDLVRARAPHIPTAMLYLSRRPADVLLDAVVEHGHAIVHPYDTMVDATFMAASRARRLTVNVWTGEVGVDRYRELIVLGVDGIITAEIALASGQDAD
jgi:glycerophosphoryl diester phosphodiesterase